MTRDEVRKQLEIILDKHDEAFRALRTVREAMTVSNEAVARR